MILATLLLLSTFQEKAASGGVTLELSIARADGAPAPMREADDVLVGLRVTDTTTGTPMGGVRPSVWMTRRTGNPERDGRPCAAKVASIASGSLFSAAEVDLNIYYVLALNTDHTITVVNPRFGFGGSHLLALVELPGRGEDWALSPDQRRLFVSIPKTDRVAVVDTMTWKVVREIDAGARPADVELQPDGRYLWVANESGVAAIDTDTLAVAAKIETGRGPHRLATTSDSRAVLVTNAGDVSLIDVPTLSARARIASGKQPVAIAWSAQSEMAYAAGADGVITIVEPKKARAVARIEIQPGIHDLRVSRDGKYAFVLNRERKLVQVIDTVSNRVTQSGITDGMPEQVNFTDTLAYITQYDSDQVLMATLATVGARGKPLSLADFPGGDLPFGRIARSGLAAGIASTPGEGAVVVANPGDGEIYYYKEGMAAPMGRFSNYRRQPAAVMTFDRSMREQTPGAFRTQARLARGGTYDVAVFIDAPRVVSCFELQVAANEELERERKFGRIAIQYLDRPQTLAVGQETALRFRIVDVKANESRPGLQDVGALVVQNPGLWRARQRVLAREDGTYELTIRPPNPGIYYVYVESRALELRLTNPQYMVFDAR